MRKIFVLILLAGVLVFSITPFAFAAEKKMTVTVSEFKDNSQEGAPAKAIQDMMVGLLVDTGRFSVIERAKIEEIGKEQRMSAQGLVEEDYEIEVGHLKAARYIITGSITEYHYLGSGAVLGVGGVGLGGASQEAHVTIDLRVVDTKTSEIVLTSRRTGVANQSQGGIVSKYGGFGTGKVGGLLSQATYNCVKALVGDINAKLK